MTIENQNKVIEKFISNVENQSLVNQGLIMIRHLRDTEDLRNSRDCSLEISQEEITEKIASEIYHDFLKSNAKAIFLSTSSKKRSLETAYQIKDVIKKMTSNDVKIFINSDDNLVDLDHGDFILPENYQTGDYYEPFEKAWKIFVEETFKKNNSNYKFGDCVKNENGIALYPEIENYFVRFGESNKDISIRLYKSVIDLYRNKGRFDKAKIRPYIITHSLPFSVFRSLMDIAYRVKNENFNFEPGTLMDVVWDTYSSGKFEKSYYGQLSEIPADIIDNDKFISMLEKELEILTAS